VLAALHTLPARQREALVLRYYLELGDAEIAASMGIREGSVRSAVHRGLATLERRMREEAAR
jgi:RNA polymerase sigma factor (sigma-70 family)